MSYRCSGEGEWQEDSRTGFWLFGRLHAYGLTFTLDLCSAYILPLYLVQGKYKEAELCYEQALEINEKEYGRDHPDVAVSLSNLGGLFNTQVRIGIIMRELPCGAWGAGRC